MTYVITSACVADYGCVDVCPADCIKPLPNDIEYDHVEQLYINPKTCINCAACVDACPVGAIFEDHQVPKKWVAATEINRKYFEHSSVRST
jgi:formate hydrogenlyase subunit 6/NADH:ubiquinone oxidoreductase subunit I